MEFITILPLVSLSPVSESLAFNAAGTEIFLLDGQGVEEKVQHLQTENVDAVRQQSSVSRRLTPADREAGGAMVDHLESMGIVVHTDNRESRRILKAAEKDNSEVGRVRHFKTVNGESYGFAYKGEIHLDMRKVDAELPLHEYAHLWCESFRRINPQGWQKVVDAMCFTEYETWDYVSKLYPNLPTDSDVAEEVIAHYDEKVRLALELQRKVLDEYTIAGTGKKLNVFLNQISANEH